jgi:hypothetical protein
MSFKFSIIIELRLKLNKMFNSICSEGIEGFLKPKLFQNNGLENNFRFILNSIQLHNFFP